MASLVGRDGSTPLHLAASSEDESEGIEAARLLLSLGADPNVQDAGGRTSVHAAASMGHGRLLDLLLANGGDPLLADVRGRSPVDWAHLRRHDGVVRQIGDLLDGEDYSGPEGQAAKFAMTFLRREVVELTSLHPSEAPECDSFYSCDTPPEENHGNALNDWNATLEDLFSRRPLGTETGRDEPPDGRDSRPPWLRDPGFLTRLRREVQRCCSDSDSNAGSFRRCMERNLLRHEGVLQPVGSLQDSPDDLDDAGCSSLLGEWSDVSDSTLDHDASDFFASADATLMQDLTDFMNQTNSQYSLMETSLETLADLDLTAPRNSVRPAACTSFNLIKAPRKRHQYKPSNDEGIFAMKKQLSEYYDESRSFVYEPEDCTRRQVVLGQSTVGSAETARSSSSSCRSFVSVAEEFLYEDEEAGVQLIERRCPTLAVVASLSSTGSRVSVLDRNLDSQKATLEQTDSGRSLDSIGTITGSVKAMSADELCLCLKNLGHVPGPIVPTTHRVYQRLLLRLRKDPSLLHRYNLKDPQYPLELRAALRDPLSVDWESWASLEKVLSDQFSRCDPTRHWRDGTNKTCFNYLLLDPRITQDLPLRGSVMDEKERLQCFISAIFYIGKGSRGRPYYHLYEAIRGKARGKQLNDKIKRIHDIWSEGVGVVSLHVFQNTIPVEAWTREACMISAIGLQNTCNGIQGTFYGLPSTWHWSERRRLGTHLLRRTLNIFMQEGERQLRPSDLTLPGWMK